MKVRRILDCSHGLYHNAPAWPDVTVPQMEMYRTHFVARDGFNLEFVKINTHFGTHLDSPWHKFDSGKRLDEFSLNSFMGEGIVLEATGKEPLGDIELGDLKPRYDSKIKNGDVVMIYTGWGLKRDYTTVYQKQWPAITPECARWLVEKKIKALGIDTFSFDKFGARDAPVHNVLLAAGLLLIEEMYLPKELLERERWWFMFLPMPYKYVGGAQCRAVAVEWQ